MGLWLLHIFVGSLFWLNVFTSCPAIGIYCVAFIIRKTIPDKCMLPPTKETSPGLHKLGWNPQADVCEGLTLRWLETHMYPITTPEVWDPARTGYPFWSQPPDFPAGTIPSRLPLYGWWKQGWLHPHAGHVTWAWPIRPFCPPGCKN